MELYRSVRGVWGSSTWLYRVFTLLGITVCALYLLANTVAGGAVMVERESTAIIAVTVIDIASTTLYVMFGVHTLLWYSSFRSAQKDMQRPYSETDVLLSPTAALTEHDRVQSMHAVVSGKAMEGSGDGDLREADEIEADGDTVAQAEWEDEEEVAQSVLYERAVPYPVVTWSFCVVVVVYQVLESTYRGYEQWDRELSCSWCNIALALTRPFVCPIVLIVMQMMCWRVFQVCAGLTHEIDCMRKMFQWCHRSGVIPCDRNSTIQYHRRRVLRVAEMLQGWVLLGIVSLVFWSANYTIQIYRGVINPYQLGQWLLPVGVLLFTLVIVASYNEEACTMSEYVVQAIPFFPASSSKVMREPHSQALLAAAVHQVQLLHQLPPSVLVYGMELRYSFLLSALMALLLAVVVQLGIQIFFRSD